VRVSAWYEKTIYHTSPNNEISKISILVKFRSVTWVAK
jgi:hypothetical protein